MLISFKSKQQKIASATLSVFLGSWLLLLCQTCLASNDEIQEHNPPAIEMTNACHESSPVEHDTETSDEHCLGICDCDAMTVTMSSDKVFDLTQKIKYNPDLYFYIEPLPVLSYRDPPTYRISSLPERAILLPFHTYNVLLI